MILRSIPDLDLGYLFEYECYLGWMFAIRLHPLPDLYLQMKPVWQIDIAIDTLLKTEYILNIASKAQSFTFIFNYKGTNLLNLIVWVGLIDDVIGTDVKNDNVIFICKLMWHQGTDTD